MRQCATIRGALLDRFNMIRLILLFTFLAFVHFPVPVYGQLTLTERLIRKEVMESGGQWEGSDRVPLLGFIGERFTDEHFEMLSHIRAIEWFHASELKVESESLRWLYGQPMLTKLDLIDTGNLIDGLHLLGASVLGRLEIVRIAETKLSRKNLSCISSMRRLKELEALDVEVEVEALRMLTSCKRLKRLEISPTNTIPIPVIEELRKALPECEIRIGGSLIGQ